MRQFWLSLLQTIARALRASARLWERAAQAVDRWLAEEGEPESPGSDPPAQWLAAVEQREPPVQWLEHVHRRQPEVRFQHYRAASAPPSPVVRRWPAQARTPAVRRPLPAPPRVAPAGDRARAPSRPARAAALRMAPAGGGTSPGAPSRAARPEGVPAARSASRPESEPDAESRAAVEEASAAAPGTPVEQQAPCWSEATGVEAGRLPAHFPESKRSAAARLLARATLFLSGRAGSTPDRESPDAPVWPPDRAPHAGPWPPPEPLAEEAPVTTRAEPVSSPWPSLPDEAVRGRAAGASVLRAGPDNPSVTGLAPADPWPSLPHIPYGVGEGSPAGDEPDVDQRALRRRQRLDDEQRGLLWNESIY